jgi:hypothetical protein
VQPPAALRLNELSVKLLVERGDTDALRACADAGNWQAREPLVELLVERGDIDALRAYADAGESWAAHRLVDVSAERGDFEALRARADAGDSFAAYWLPELSARHLADTATLTSCAPAPMLATIEPKNNLLSCASSEETLTHCASALATAENRLTVDRFISRPGDVNELRAR